MPDVIPIERIDHSNEINELLPQIRAVADLLMAASRTNDVLLDDTVENAACLIERLSGRVIDLQKGGAS